MRQWAGASFLGPLLYRSKPTDADIRKEETKLSGISLNARQFPGVLVVLGGEPGRSALEELIRFTSCAEGQKQLQHLSAGIQIREANSETDILMAVQNLTLKVHCFVGCRSEIKIEDVTDSHRGE
jgi:hypothetical protein